MAVVIRNLSGNVTVKVMSGKICLMKDGIVFKTILPNTCELSAMYQIVCENPELISDAKDMVALASGKEYDSVFQALICPVDWEESIKPCNPVISITDSRGAGYQLLTAEGIIAIVAATVTYYTCYYKSEDVLEHICFILMHLGFVFGQESPSNWSIKESSTLAAITTYKELQTFCETYKW